MELVEFLSNNRIEERVWKAAQIDWGVLSAIYSDHLARTRQLEDAAAFFVKSMQSFDGVHSVRWRVKDPEHLIEKIVRKRGGDAPSERYAAINVENYHEIVTDLIGVRALHLFKDDCLQIHDQIEEMWDLHEPAVSYEREGDNYDFSPELIDRSINSKVHPAGYRSVHYVLKTKPASRETLVEVQVRTVFEEGWSEIDHKVRYPNFSKNSQIEDVLKIFNRLAGSADELGGFIKSLSSELDQRDKAVENAVQDRDAALEEMQKLLTELADEKRTKGEMIAKAELLQQELNKATKAIKQKAERDADVLRAIAARPKLVSRPTIIRRRPIAEADKK